MYIGKLLIFFLLFSLWGCSDKDLKSSSNFYDLKIQGEITESTLDEFKKALESIEKEHKDISLNAVQLNSNGGSAFVGRGIGRIIREKRLNTYVAEDARCESACIFILIGGVQRYPFGRVGVHRTTYDKDIDDDDRVEKDINEALNITSEYIKSMGVSMLLDDAINTTESWRMRYLTDLEKRQWQVFGVDRLEEELQFNKIAKQRQIPRSEFIDIFKDNFDECLKYAKDLKMTVFECSSNKKRKSLLIRWF